MTVHRDDGLELDAIFKVEQVGGAPSIVFEARGGTRGSAAARNSDHAAALELLLARLAEVGCAITDILVESRETARLPPEERRIALEGRPYALRVDDPAALRGLITARQAKIGRAPGARSGRTRTRRLRIHLEPTPELAGDLALHLSRGRAR